MSTLHWRPVETLELNEALVTDPSAEYQQLRTMQHARVAVEGAFLHVDPRKPNQRSGDGEYKVFIVPASAVRSVVYRTDEPAVLEPQLH